MNRHPFEKNLLLSADLLTELKKDDATAAMDKQQSGRHSLSFDKHRPEDSLSPQVNEEFARATEQHAAMLD